MPLIRGSRSDVTDEIPHGRIRNTRNLLAAAALSASNLARGATHPSTSDTYVEGRVVRISPRVAGQVIALHVDDNSRVQAGDPLLEIDPADYQAKVDQARAAVSIATIQQADAAVERAQAAIGEADAVKLTLNHTMDKPNSKFAEAVSTGWPPILSSLKSLLETGESLEFTRKWPDGM